MPELLEQLAADLSLARRARRTGYKAGVHDAAARALDLLGEMGHDDLALKLYKEIYKLTEVER